MEDQFGELPRYYKVNKKKSWKFIGMKFDNNFDEWFDYYLNETNCWNCGKEFMKRFDKHLHHDHRDGEPIMIICRLCNANIDRPTGKTSNTGIINITKRIINGIEYYIYVKQYNGKKKTKYFNTKKYTLEDVKQIIALF
jgi:hypothetical protein